MTSPATPHDDDRPGADGGAARPAARPRTVAPTPGHADRAAPSRPAPLPRGVRRPSAPVGRHAVPAAPSGRSDAGDVRRRALQLVRVLVVVAVVVGVLTALGVNRYERAEAERQEAQRSTERQVQGSGWPDEVNGRPSGLGGTGQSPSEVTPTEPPGVYLWSDFDGWHLWVVAGAGVPAQVTGTVLSDDALAAFQLAAPDGGTAEHSGQQGTFALDTTRPVTGVDFSTGFFGRRLTITFDGPDGELDPALVHVGSEAERAPDPLVIRQR